MAKSLITYCGGKVNKMRGINALISAHYKPKEKKFFIDAFGGGGNVAFNIDKSLFELIIYNDLDNGIYSLIKQIRDNADELVEALLLTPYSRTEFNKCKEGLYEPGISDLERARRKYVIIMQSMFRLGKYFRLPSYRTRSGYPYFFKKIELLKGIAKEISQWCLENRDGLEVARSFSDCEDCLVFLDPPYLGVKNSSYYREAPESLDLFEGIIEFANSAKCNIIICNYDNGFYDERLVGFTKQCFEARINSSVKKGNAPSERKKDCLWYRFN